MANGHGGARRNAGRKRGHFGKKRQDAITLAKAAGLPNPENVTPVSIMLARMTELWERGDDDSKDRACSLACDAAPYIHHKLSAIDMTAETVTSHVVRLPAKSASAEEWLTDYMIPAAPPIQ